MDRFQKKMIGARIADRYLVTGTIGSGGMGLVLSAIPFEDPSREVAIKVIRSKRMGPDVLMRFQKEAALMSRLHHPCIISFLELGLMDAESAGFVQGRVEPDSNEKAGERDDGAAAPSGYYIVMERANGRDLKEIIGRNGRQSLRFFFQLGSQVAQALDYTHRKNIIHRDIKPQNIIVDRPFGDSREVLVKVLDFGVASLSEAVLYTGHGGQGPGRRSGDLGDEVAGTPLYMAPELTRMIDAPVDHRVDLYSLGCVLYETLSGHTPFAADAREKLEKLHAFASPEPLSTRCPDVPPYVEAIVHKLLAKHPDQRYQSAFGLQADLARAKALHESGNLSADALPLGRYDQIEILSRPMKFNGRSAEMAVLQQNYEAVASAQGRSRMLVLRGPAGSGKSRLISEFRENLVGRQIRFVSGRFSSHESALPFNALANAFNEYLMRLSRSKSAEAAEFHEKVKTLLGPLAHQIAQVVPGLLPFVADIPEPEVMFGPDEEGFKAFAKVFSDFTRCLASDSTPFIFIFDDLQWADDKSIRLIDRFFSNANSQRFLLIASVRSASVAQGSEVEAFLNRFSRLKRRFTEVQVNPVSRANLAPLVEATLGVAFLGDSKTESRFIDWLYARTGGNLLHVTELLRVLVANDHLRMQSSGVWLIDNDRLAMDPPKVDSVDLVLGRLADFKESDRRALEAAAVVGMTFQFEILRGASGSAADGNALGEGHTDGDSAMSLVQALQRAVDEGIIQRGGSDDELKALGKSFTFVHSRAREDIYGATPVVRRAALHLATARRLEATVPNPTGKIVFALAQHYNRALEGGSEIEANDKQNDFRGLLLKAIQYNLQAGETALASNSVQTAETYFKSVERLMERAGPGGVQSSAQLHVLEVLADLAAAQRRTSDAFRRYRALISKAMPDGQWITLAAKVTRFYVSLGIFSESMKLLESSLDRLGTRMVPQTLWNRITAWFRLWMDGTFSDRRWSRSWKLLRHALSRKSALRLSRPSVELYQSVSHVMMYRNRTSAFLAHDRAFNLAVAVPPSVGGTLRLVAERASMLACHGYYQASFRDFDLVMDIAKASGARSEFAYASLLRVLSADYLCSRHDEMSDHLRMVVTNLKPDQDRLAHGIAISFQIYRELHRLNFDRVKALSVELPAYRALRSPVSSRSVMISTFAFLLRDSRDEIVNFAESFLKHRRDDGGRMDDLFTMAVLAMVAFARGEMDKARKSYARIIREFPATQKGEFLWPFEEDCLSLFLIFFPSIYSREAGSEIIPAVEMGQALRDLRGVVSGMREPNRSVPLLVQARIAELTGNPERARVFYDRSLRQAKLAGDNLVQVIGYFWFGEHLSERGLKPRMDYLRKASVLAAKGGVKALSVIIARSASVAAGMKSGSGQINNDGRATPDGGLVNSALGDSVAMAAATRSNDLGPWAAGKLHPMEVAMLRVISGSEMRRLDATAELEECLTFIAKSFNGSRVFCFRRGALGQGLQNAGPAKYSQDVKKIADHLAPYVQIRSTLFLPLHDAPWIQAASRESALGHTSVSAPEEDILTVAPVRIFPGDQGTPAAKPGFGNEVERTASGLGIVVPLRWGAENIGLLFIEESGPLAHESTTSVRHALDRIGAQLAVAMERRIRSISYRSGVFHLEQQPWLRTWDFGNFRAQRETGWYLGLNFGDDRHILFYLSCSGPEEARAKFGANLWHYLFAVRSVLMAEPTSEIEPHDIRTELAKYLLADRAIGSLEQVNLSFSIISRTKNLALSGHFGLARPIVVNGSNRVSPGNESLMTLSGGRELRYWDVESNLGEQQVLIVSYDTSRLDGVQMVSPHSGHARSGSQPLDDLFTVERPAELHQVLAARLPVDVLPRCYVAVMRQRSAKAVAASGPAPTAGTLPGNGNGTKMVG